MLRMGTASLAALLLGLAGVNAVRAGDVMTLKLGGGSASPTLTLGGAESAADTLEVRHYGGYYGGYRGGYRGYYGGYHGYRPAYYYRPVVTYSYYSYRPAYYAPPVYYYRPSYCYGISEVDVTPTLKTILPPVPRMDPAPQETPLKPTPMTPSSTGPYQYDGGPNNPVPMPQGTRPGATPRPTVPLEGRPVSLPSTTTTARYAYPAYGQPSSGSQSTQDRTLVIKK